MDFNVISRLESHSEDLFKLGQRRLRPIREGDAVDENESLSPPESRSSRKAGDKKVRVKEERAADKNKRAASAPDPEQERPELVTRREPQSKPVAFDDRSLPPSRKLSFGSKATDNNTNDSLSEGSSASDEDRPGRRLSQEEAKMAKGRQPARLMRKAHYEDLWAAITRNIGKGFVLGYVGKVGINLLYPILNLVRGRKLGLSQELVLFDAREYGLFWGSMLGIYNGWMFESKKYVAEFDALKRYRGLVAGALAGLSLFWVPRAKRWPIVLFTLVRALELQVKLLVRRGFLPSLPHSDVGLMGLASASMLHSWVLHPGTLERSYTGFLTKQSQVPPAVREALAMMYTGKPLDIAALNAARAKMSVGARPLTNPLNYDTELGAGEILLPNQSLFTYVPKFFARAMGLALPVYLPVFSVPILIFYPSVLIKRPVETVRRVLSGVLRSSLFLSLYTTMGFNSVSVMRAMGLKYSNVGSFGQIIFVFAGIISGLATAIEKKSRRIELALYVLSKAIEGRWNQLVQSGAFKPPRDGDVLVFMYSFAIIAHVYTRHSSMLRSAYTGILSRFFDTDERHKFYSIPRIVSKQLLGSRRNLSQRVLASLVERADDNEDEAGEDPDSGAE